MQDKPNALIIVGITGDLSTRKLLPALVRLERDGMLDDNLHIIGTSRRDVDIESIFKDMKNLDSQPKNALEKLKKRITIVQADVGSKEGAVILRDKMEDILPRVCKTKLFYFAIPPSALRSIIHNLVAAEIHTCGGSVASRLLIEKPFGSDLESAKDLSETITKYFGPESIYLIDHYLAKETVQNILYLRFHNPMLRSIWTEKDIKSIHISALEKLDIQGRGDFYEETGALRDMLQSHLMQLLAITTMQEPRSMQSQDIRKNRLELLQEVMLESGDPSTATRAQYEGYKSEVDSQDSLIETYAKVRINIDSDRWKNVPITLEAGKAMESKKTEIKIVFKGHKQHMEENSFVFQIQPNEGIVLTLAVKKPGLESATKSVDLEYCYDSSTPQSDGYEKILYDAIMGDQSLFPSEREIINNWELFQPILDLWQKDDAGLIIYKKGSKNIESLRDLK